MIIKIAGYKFKKPQYLPIVRRRKYGGYCRNCMKKIDIGELYISIDYERWRHLGYYCLNCVKIDHTDEYGNLTF